MRNQLWRQVEAYLPQLWRIARTYEANPALQEELLQEISLAIWESLPNLREVDKLRGFVLRIAHNMAATHVAQAMRSGRTVPLDEVSLGYSNSDAPGSQLLDAVRSLPVPLRQVIALQLEGLSYQEIGDVLEIDPNNVGVRVHRAKKLLQELLDAKR